MPPAARAVQIQGNAQNTLIITGDHNTLQLSHQSDFSFRPLDAAFRQAQRQAAPADFYNGSRPNWANIAQGHDAQRALLQQLLDFIHDPQKRLPPQRVGVITGLSGEGKTTLLMRTLWQAAEAGLPVLWQRHTVLTSGYQTDFPAAGPLVLGLDDLPFAPGLLAIIAELHESGQPFVLLGTARQHEWGNSGLASALARHAHLRTFPVQRLGGEEVDDLLARLRQHDMLGALADQPPARQRRYFLDRLQADGQLLPALLTARRGRSFAAILEDVFRALERQHGREQARQLMRGYAGIALVHRFGFWLSRPLLAAFSGIEERQLTPQLLRPLQGELTEITAASHRLYTRHPWIAEQALQILCGPYLEEENYLYQDLFAALQGLLQAAAPPEERKLLSMLPLAFRYRGDFDRARQLFQQAAQADPTNAPTLQAWALMEAQRGQPQRALEILAQGLARIHRRRDRALLLSTRAGLLARQERWPEAEADYRQALELHERNPHTHYHYAVDFLLKRGRTAEACRHLQRALALNPRKKRHRQRIQRALQRHCQAGSDA